MARARSSWAKIARSDSARNFSTCRSCTISSAASASRATCLPSKLLLVGVVSQSLITWAGLVRSIKASSEGASRNLSRTNTARFSPMRSLLRGMMAVCRPTSGIGIWRNRAETANQSATAPTMAASHITRRQDSQTGGTSQRADNKVVTKKPRVTSKSSSSGSRLAACSDRRCSDVSMGHKHRAAAPSRPSCADLVNP